VGSVSASSATGSPVMAHSIVFAASRRMFIAENVVRVDECGWWLGRARASGHSASASRNETASIGDERTGLKS
jgi:hypothetical protein